mgnify:CR=1 FL=1
MTATANRPITISIVLMIFPQKLLTVVSLPLPKSAQTDELLSPACAHGSMTADAAGVINANVVRVVSKAKMIRLLFIFVYYLIPM